MTFGPPKVMKIPTDVCFTGNKRLNRAIFRPSGATRNLLLREEHKKQIYGKPYPYSRLFVTANVSLA
jgi:hypothetical protein